MGMGENFELITSIMDIVGSMTLLIFFTSQFRKGRCKWEGPYTPHPNCPAAFPRPSFPHPRAARKYDPRTHGLRAPCAHATRPRRPGC